MEGLEGGGVSIHKRGAYERRRDVVGRRFLEEKRKKGNVEDMGWVVARGKGKQTLCQNMNQKRGSVEVGDNRVVDMGIFFLSV